MIRFPTKEAEELRQSETRQSLTFALVFGVFTICLTLAAALFGWLLAVPFTGYLSALVFIGGGIYVFVILRAGWMRGGGVVNRVVEVAERWLDAEIELKSSARALPPAPTLPLPPENRVIPHTILGRGGELALDLIDGFDPRDLDWFAKYLANGNKWTEAALEHMPLPHSGILIGKDREGAPYRKLMTKCVNKSIIGGRGGPGNPSGKLAVTDEKMIARLLKEPD